MSVGSVKWTIDSGKLTVAVNCQLRIAPNCNSSPVIDHQHVEFLPAAQFLIGKEELILQFLRGFLGCQGHETFEGAMELFGADRKKVSLIIAVLSAIAAVLICLGYNVLYFELPLPNGQAGQLLDVMDYISNSFLMPLISLLTCVFIGWVLNPRWIAEEMELGGCRFGRKKLYGIMIRYIAPVIMAVLFVQSMGLLS